MKINLSKALLATLLASTIQSGLAAEQNYGLLDIYQLAEKNDAQLAAAQASLNASQEIVPMSQARLLPMVSLSANTNYTRISKPIDQNFNSNGWSLSAVQPLVNISSLYGLEKAEAQSKQAEAVFANEQQLLIMRVSEGYFSVLRAEDRLTTALSQEKAVKKQLERARETYNVGMISETDVLEAQAVYDGTRVARIMSENGVAVAYEGLRTLTNQTINRIAQLNKAMPVTLPVPDNSSDWVDTAVDHSIALDIGRSAVKVAEHNVRTSKAGHMPTLNAVAGYSVSNTQQMGMYDTEGAQVGLQFSLPIFSGGMTSSQVRQASYQLDQAQQNYDKSLRDINSAVRNLHRMANSDVATIDARCQGIRSSESALTSTQSGYEVGSRNISDVLNAQQKLYASTGDYLNARYDFITDTLKLKQAAGTLKINDLKQLDEWLVSHNSDEAAIPAECKAG